MFDILMYLFECYVLGDFDFKKSPKFLAADLRREGFPQEDIHEAFQWLEGLSLSSKAKSLAEPEITSQGTRIFSPWECARLSCNARGFLLLLEASGILTSALREQVIDRAMALDIDYIDLSEIKLILIMVLGARTKEDKKFKGLQEFLLAEKAHETLH